MILLLVTFFTLFVSLLHTLVDWVNYRHSQSCALPEDFRDVFPAEKYEEAKRYLAAQTKFRILQRSLWTVASLAFLWLGGFALVDAFARQYVSSPIAVGLLFFAVLGLVSEIFSLPFAVYSTFGLETKFGFNRSTPATFVKDQLLGLGLGIVVGGPVLAALFWFFLSAGRWGWLWAWGFLALFQVVMGFLAPVLLLPLFNKFTPLAAGELRGAIEEYAGKVSFKLQGIFTMDGSKRSTKANAFFTGFGRFRRIVLFDTLVSKHTTPELVAVLAHEVGHFKRGHILKNLFFSLASTFVLFFGLSMVLGNPVFSAAFGPGRLSTRRLHCRPLAVRPRFSLPRRDRSVALAQIRVRGR